MDSKEALNKYSKYFNEDDIESIVEVNDAFVFYAFNALQPVIVKGDIVRGLNGNDTEDRKIIDIAAFERIKTERG